MLTLRRFSLWALVPTLLATLLGGACRCVPEGGSAPSAPGVGPHPAFVEPPPPGALHEGGGPGQAAGHYGGQLVLPTPADPKTFNPLLANEYSTTQMLFPLVFTGLTRWDPLSLKDEPELAERWEASADGLEYTFFLRAGLRWSDGAPFDERDVLFTFGAVFDPALATSTKDLFVDSEGRLPQVDSPGPLQVRFRLREVNVLFLAAVGSVYLGPRHHLEAAHARGELAQAYSVATPPAQIAGLGPFRIAARVPGQRVVLERNPYFWKIDAAGQRLPYLDRLIWVVLPDADATLLRFERGELDLLDELRAEQYDLLLPAKETGRAELLDLGPSLATNYLSFNWSAGTLAEGRPRVDPKKRAWFADVRFRRAVSHAIDRAWLVRTVLLGRGRPLYCFDSESNTLWSHPCKRYPHDPARAAALLDEMDLRDRDGDGLRETAEGVPVAFEVITNAENQERVAVGTALQADLAQVGLRMELRPVPFNALVTRMRETQDWEGLILGWGSAVPPDPILSKNIFASSGQLHLWNPRQETPATAWEARIDELLGSLGSSLDLAARQAQYHELSDILAEQQAQIFTYNSNQYVAVRPGLGNLQPTIYRPHAYWNAHRLYWIR